MKENRLKPAGEWNVYDLRCDGSKCTLAVNGVITSTTDSAGEKGYVGDEAADTSMAGYARCKSRSDLQMKRTKIFANGNSHESSRI